MLTDRDLPTLQAAASALRHAPPAMRTAHLAERLEEMARRLEALERVATLMPAVLECRERAATTQESLHVGGDDAE